MLESLSRSLDREKPTEVNEINAEKVGGKNNYANSITIQNEWSKLIYNSGTQDKLFFLMAFRYFRYISNLPWMEEINTVYGIYISVSKCVRLLILSALRVCDRCAFRNSSKKSTESIKRGKKKFNKSI